MPTLDPTTARRQAELPEFIAALESYLRKYPQMRVGQAIVNAAKRYSFGRNVTDSLFYVENATLARWIREMEEAYGQ